MGSLIGCFQSLSSPIQAWLKEQLTQLKLFEERVEELEDVIKKLKEKTNEVKHKVEEEEHRHGRGITGRVKKWREKVNKIISEYEDFVGDVKHRNLVQFELFKSGYLPKPGIRYRLSKKAYDTTKQVNKLLETIPKPDEISFWPGSPRIDDFVHNVGYVPFTSRDETMKNIKAALEDPSVTLIGLHGLKGVGKITLVKEIAKEVLDAKTFKVAMASVTRNPDIRKIQVEISETLGMKLGEESNLIRAVRIKDQLRRKSTLVILDDLWAKLDLKELGIPSENDDSLKNVKEGKSSAAGQHGTKKTENPGASSEIKVEELPGTSEREIEETPEGYKGCKVLLISESKQLLLSQMEGKENYIFSMEVLEEEEAATLFKNIAGIDNGDSKYDKLAAQIANKSCYGLPKSIIDTAKELKNQSRSTWDWEDAHRKLERQKLTGTPEFSTKLCYDLLQDQDKELQGIFLLSACLGPDALIMDLVKYCIGLDVLEGINSVREARNRVHPLIGKLKLFGLLCDSYSSDRFTMQDIVRNAALSIAFQEKHVFTMTKGKIDEWLDKLERYAAISLHHCDIAEGFLKRINYPGLGVFHVVNKDPWLEIPQNFFEGMKELKVLILTGINLSPSNSSIASLKKLTTLCLEQCMLDKELSFIGNLKELRILSFSGSDIEELPAEGQTDSSGASSLSELRHLSRLTTLDIQIPNVAHLPKELLFNKLDGYKIIVGDVKAYLETELKMPEKYEVLRFLAIQLKDGSDIHSQEGIKMMFDGVENLLLEDLYGVQDIFYRLNLNGFPCLKHLSIVSNSEIQSLIKPKDRQHPEKAFPELESLYLYNLKNMEEICSCKLSKPSFANLKVLKINLCSQLKSIFSISMVRVRLQDVLETIEVSECNSLEKIVPVETQSNTNEIELLTFPKLHSLTLRSLSEFIGFYPMSSTEGETRELFHEKVVVSELKRMELSSIKIDIIWSDKTSLVNLQSLFVSECEKMRYIFTKGQESDAIMKGIFPNLKNIKLSSMTSLCDIWNHELPSDSFGRLDTLIIEECDKFVNVFPCYMEGIFQSLCNLRVTNCRSMKAIFDLDDKKQDTGGVTNLQDVHLEILPKLKHVWKWNKDRKGIFNLNKLQKIWIQDCDCLENIFPFSEAKYLNNLGHLVVWDCSKLREIIAKEEGTNIDTSSNNISFEFPNLTTIKFSKLPKLKTFYPGAYELSCEKLNDLSVELCDKLELFRKGTTFEQRKPALFPEEVIYKLKSMQIELRHAKSSSSYMGKGNYRRDNLEELQLCRLKNTDIPYSFLYSNPNLKSLSLVDCFFEEVVPLRRSPELQNVGVVPKLRSLKLIDLPNLKNIGFERDKVLQRIELLILRNSPCLVNIMPSSVSLIHLTYLEVAKCNGLKTLMSPSTAKSMGQLNTMKVIECESLKEIIGNEKENADIVFRQLKALELVSLKSLESFCSSKSCVFVFPSLEKLIVSACPKMENFSEKVKCTPLLQKIHVIHEKEKKRWDWKDDLNATIRHIFKEKKFFEGMDEINVSEHPQLTQTCLKELEVRDCNNIEVIFDMNDTGTMGIIAFQLKKLTLESLCKLTHVWENNHQVSLSFRNLQQVIVRGCENLKTLFPAALAKNLMKLKKLEIESCDELLEIVEKETAGKMRKKFVFPCLTSLHLSNLPNLTCFYPETFTLECPLLNDLTVYYCVKFELFQSAHLDGDNEGSSPSINRQPLFSDLKAISNLEELSLDWKDTSVLRLRFRQFMGNLAYLTVLYLNLYDWDEHKKPMFPFDILDKAPNVKELYIYYCSSPKILLTQNPKIGEDRVLGHMEILSLNHITELQSVGTVYSSCLNTICNDTLQLQSLIQVKILDCPNMEIFSQGLIDAESLRGIQIDDDWAFYNDLNVFGGMKFLQRVQDHLVVDNNSPLLQAIWLQSKPVPDTIFRNLKSLIVEGCEFLSNAIPSHLLPSLSNLEELQVRKCNSIKAVFDHTKLTNMGPGSDPLPIRLKKLILDQLPILKHVWNEDPQGSLSLPFLEEVLVDGCETIKRWRNLRKSKQRTYNIPQHNLVEVMEFAKSEMLNFFVTAGQDSFLTNQQAIELSKVTPCLKELSLGKEEAMMIEQGKLHVDLYEPYSLKLQCFSDESDVFAFVYSSKVLLHSIEKLGVVHSSFKEIFPSRGPLVYGKISRFLSELKGLKLQSLPQLESIGLDHSWMEYFTGNLETLFVSACDHLTNLTPSKVSFSKLTELKVEDCGGLKNLFASSTARTLDALKEMHVSNCASLQNIVTDGDVKDITFNKLEILNLSSLPKLGSFYSGSSTLKFPSLKVVSFTQCYSTKVFRLGDIVPEELKVTIDGVCWEGDINYVIMQ
ncbi:P-loop containing nucleoside triphosphate hydrolase [Sesbania bispinosa]|nr:P-loop containing nucleoside triphosphate hydrolase [Sesbania bispinosa]